MLIGIIGWIVVGLLVGFIASRVVNLHGDDPRLGMGTAVAGAVVAAVLYTVVSGAGVSAFNVWSLVFASVGAVAGIVGWHGVRSHYVSRAPQTRRQSY